MRSFYVLEYKIADSKGREKNAQFAGVFKSLEDIENAKKVLLEDNSKNITFQVYNPQSVF